VNTEKTPACPRCGREDLARRASAFAISKGRKEEPKPEAPPGPDIDEARLEKAMEALAGDMDSIDENDPKQGAHLMRKLFSATGMPIGAGMAEALKRMESGEDPEKIEEEMGDVFEEDPFGGLLGGEGAGADPGDGKKNLARLRRMLRPPTTPSCTRCSTVACPCTVAMPQSSGIATDLQGLEESLPRGLWALREVFEVPRHARTTGAWRGVRSARPSRTRSALAGQERATRDYARRSSAPRAGP